MLRTRLCLGALLIAGAPAAADELTLPSSIASVTVYPSGATVVRTASVTLPVGASVVTIDDLPMELEADSLKVEGKADQTISIASVEARSVDADAVKDPKRVAIEDEIQSIEDKIAAADDKIGALDGRRRFLEKLIEATPEGFGKALAENGDGIDRWSAAAATIGEGLATVADQTRATRLEQRELNRQLEERRAALEDLPEPREHMAVRIALSTDTVAKGTLSISYHTQSARWLPTYDAQLSTGESGGEPSLAIVRRAEVTQDTGEDWSDVALTLSTTRTVGGTAAPDLSPFLVSLYDPDVFQSESALGRSDGGLAASAPAKMLDAPTAADAVAPAEHREAVADFGDFRAEYRVPGRVSVESGVGARSLQIATEKATAKLDIRAVPVLSEAAYLQASFTPPAGAPLLAGKVALFRDGTFVGNGQVPFTNAGKELDLGFGVDDRVHVVRTALARDTGEHGIFSSRKTDLRRYKITVENLHARPVDITILDRVPYAEDDTVEVVRVKESSAPTSVDVDDRRGVLAWSYTYAPGESRDILNGYEVSWPADKSLVSLD